MPVYACGTSDIYGDRDVVDRALALQCPVFSFRHMGPRCSAAPAVQVARLFISAQQGPPDHSSWRSVWKLRFLLLSPRVLPTYYLDGRRRIRSFRHFGLVTNSEPVTCRKRAVVFLYSVPRPKPNQDINIVSFPNSTKQAMEMCGIVESRIVPNLRSIQKWERWAIVPKYKLGATIQGLPIPSAIPAYEQVDTVRL